LLLAHATWIVAEIPQACRRQAEELERKARFFCGLAAKKCAKMLTMTEKSKRRCPALVRGFFLWLK
jgi:hypothetical protein